MLGVVTAVVVCVALVSGHPEKRNIQLDPGQPSFELSDDPDQKRDVALNPSLKKRDDDEKEKKVEEIIHKLQEEYEEQRRTEKRSSNSEQEMEMGKRGRQRKNRKQKIRRKSLVPSSLKEAKEMSIYGKTSPSRTSQADKEKVIELHRKFRHEETAGNIWHIDYDETLADLAQGLVDTCVFKHTNLMFANKTDVGQNLAVLSGGELTIDLALELFHRERQYYDFTTMSFENFNKVGHYLQLVNWETSKVGCAVNKCEKLYLPDSGRIWNDAWYWACDYYPPLTGNKPPFEKGQKCTKCQVPMGSKIGWKCAEDGCEACARGSEGCNDPQECSPSECEKDVDPVYCSMMKQMNYCDYEHAMKDNRYLVMRLYCGTTCRICKDIPNNMIQH